MIITTVEEASAPGVLGKVLDCFEAGDVKELVLCDGEMTVIMTNGTQIAVPGDVEPESWSDCPKCGVDTSRGQSHTCENPIKV